MNWNEIKSKYPKAFEKFNDFAKCDFEYEMRKDYWEIFVGYCENEKIYTDARGEEVSGVLFKFFDANEIYVVIKTYDEWKGKYQDSCVLRFSFLITDEKLRYQKGWDKEGYRTRTEAEEKAFEKAFEILENKLNK